MINRFPGVFRACRAVLLGSGLGLLSASLQLSLVQAGDDATKLAWRVDLGQAQAEAKSRNLLLWIQFTGPWCGNCRRMEASAFAYAPVIREARERFVPVKLRSDEYETLAQSLGLSVLPSTVIVRPNGEVVDKWEGYGEPAEFTNFLVTTLRAEGRSPEQVAARSLATAKVEKDPAIALAGYDPVTLLNDQKLVPGRPDLVVEHDGRVFRFANEAGRDTFLREPDSFTPVNGGRCPVSQVDRGDLQAGDPHWGVVYHGHLFLFKDPADRDRFAKDPERYARVDRSNRASCPHCRERSTLARRMANRFSTMFTTQQPITNPATNLTGGPTSPTIPLTDRLASFLALDPVIRR